MTNSSGSSGLILQVIANKLIFREWLHLDASVLVASFFNGPDLKGPFFTLKNFDCGS